MILYLLQTKHNIPTHSGKKQRKKPIQSLKSSIKQIKANMLLLNLQSSTAQITASTSSGSSDSFGGLYESVALGQMVPDFEKWVYR